MTSIEIASQIELELMENIARALKGGNIGSAKWQLDKLADIGALDTRNRRVVRRYAAQLDTAMQKEVASAMNSRLRFIDRGFMAVGLNASAVADVGIQEMITGYSMSVAGQANIIGNNLLRAANQTYRDSLAVATQATVSGIYTPQQAMSKTVSEWSRQGLPALVDKAGRTWQPDSYVNMQLRTAQTAGMTEMTLQRSRDFGNDLIEIDSHAGARELCEPYQGKIFSLSGKHGNFPALSSTSYGDPAGIFGINCTHNMYPYIEGVSEKTYSPYSVKENNQVYQESQRQRLLERRIRESKREVAALNAAGVPVDNAEKLLNNRQAMMKDFIESTGRTRYRIKEAV